MHVARIMANDGHSQKDIAEKLGVSDRMVRKYLKPDFGTRARKTKKSVLEPFYGFINALLEDDPFINLVPVFEQIQRRGYTGGMTILRDYARKVRKRITTKAVRRYETEPGLQAQVDWKECGRWNIEGELMKLYAFVMVLGYSRKRPEGTVLVFANFTADGQAIAADMTRWGGLNGKVVNLLTPGRPVPIDQGRLRLAAYEVMWLTSDEDAGPAEACCG